MMNREGIFKLPDTGQITCYDRDGKRINPAPEDELYGQNGSFIVNPMSFTKLGYNGKKLNDSATWDEGYRMVLDNNTGLIWEVKSPYNGDINYCEDTYSWDEAKDLYIKRLNEERYGGFSDWRLPNKDELRSIIDYSRTNPAVDTWYFPHCKSAFYWSSLPYLMEPPFVWGIFFGLGSGICYTPYSKQYVRAVRGGYSDSFGNPDKCRFVDNGDGTITDLTTSLMWQKEENERMDWYSAIAYCKSLRLAGYSDWRLPNIKELNTILNLNYTNGWWYYKDYFPAKGLQPPLLHYFSSTSYEGIYVWVTNFCFGYDGYYAAKTAKLLFRAVRNVEPTKEIKKYFCLPHSGQIRCYNDEGTIIVVPKKGERFYGQDGSIIINELSFTKLREDGKEIEDDVPYEKGWRLVRDNNTGLVWEIKSPHPWDINFVGKRYTWDEANRYIELLNRYAWCGFTDWRMPNREELRTIANYNGQIPAVDNKYFSDCLPVFYWSKDIYAKDNKLVWGIYFAYGCAICYLKESFHYVRAVRGGYNLNFGDASKYSLRDNQDGTVTDLNTGLMWKKEESPELNWEEAMNYCQELNLAGYNDWRLPTIKEIATLIDLSYKDNCWHHKDFFPNVKTLPQGFYWSCTTYGDTLGWGVNFQFGYDGYYAGKRKGKYPFRPVRSIGI
ncbi:MAG: DUF1566 domain-containing protein [Candidatus Omnitrophica bacterium]|nr:DUF1566 domain-containing protein [Candidatus Omnitrophota bacterium]